RCAALALGDLGDVAAGQALVGKLESTTSKTVREGVAIALGKLRCMEAVFPLIELLGSQDDNLILAAVGALGNLKDERAIGPLVKALVGRPSTYQRCEAIVQAL